MQLGRMQGNAVAALLFLPIVVSSEDLGCFVLEQGSMKSH